jgi:hypothetical protein
MNCGAEGSTSLVCDVPAGSVMDGQDGPVLVHVTVCRQHVRPVKAWLWSKAVGDSEPMVTGTEYLLRHWGQIVESTDLPVFGMVNTG